MDSNIDKSFVIKPEANNALYSTYRPIILLIPKINSIEWEICTTLSSCLGSTWQLLFVKHLIKQPKMEKCMYRWLIWDYCQCRIFSVAIEYKFHIEKYPDL